MSISFIIILLWSLVQPFTETSSEEELLKRGLALENQGNIEAALDAWEKSFVELSEPSFAIGREYIRVVTEQEFKERYKTASSIYLWGLSSTSIPEDKIELFETEVEMLKPIAGDNNYKAWVKMLDDKDDELISQIYRFWQTMDPTPSTTRYNERLIEHWERIAHSRENFTRARNSAYGTDERGIYYVKFGKADFVSENYLEATRGQVYAFCESFGTCDAPTMMAAIFQLRDRPYFELWVYYNDDPSVDNTLVMFGTTGTDPFQQILGVEDLIPDRAFSLSTRFDRTTLVGETVAQQVSPGQVMQFIYYQQVAAKDEFFARQYNELEFVFTGSSDDARVTRSQGFVNRERAKANSIQILNAAPEEVSSYERNYFGMNMNTYHYRFLSKDLIPYTVSFIESYPGVQFVQDVAHNEAVYPQDDFDTEGVLADYSLKHTVKVLNDKDELTLQKTVPANLVIDPNEENPSSSVFTIPNVNSIKQKIILSAILENANEETTPRFDTPFDQNIRGLGKLDDDLPKPLSSKGDKLIMADLVFGYQLNPNSDEDILFPFVVSNTREIPENESLAIHLEIYNLEQDRDGISRFKVEYQITEPRSNLKILGDKSTGVSLTLDFVHDDERFIEDLEIQTRDLVPGSYTLKLKTIDTISGKSTSSEVDFEVLESLSF